MGGGITADRGKWLKLWLDSLTDLDIANLSNEDWGFLTRLWMLIKKEGTAGSITLERPALIPCALLHVPDFDFLITQIYRSIPSRNVTVDVTVDKRYITITFCKWLKYQGDWSGERVAKFRENQKSVTANVTVAHTSSSISTSSSIKGVKERSGKPLEEAKRIHIDKLEFTDSMKAYASKHGINGHAIDLFGDMVRWVVKKGDKLTNTQRGWEAQFQTFVNRAPEMSPKYIDHKPSQYKDPFESLKKAAAREEAEKKARLGK